MLNFFQADGDDERDDQNNSNEVDNDNEDFEDTSNNTRTNAEPFRMTEESLARIVSGAVKEAMKQTHASSRPTSLRTGAAAPSPKRRQNRALRDEKASDTKEGRRAYCVSVYLV